MNIKTEVAGWKFFSDVNVIKISFILLILFCLTGQFSINTASHCRFSKCTYVGDFGDC